MILKVFVRVVGTFFAPAPLRSWRCFEREDNQIQEGKAKNSKKAQQLVGTGMSRFVR